MMNLEEHDIQIELALPPVIPDAVVEGWLHEKFMRTHSDKTVEAYRSHMHSFRDYAIAHGARRLGRGHPDLPQFFAACIQKWAPSGVKGTLAPSSVNTRMAAVSSFFEYAHRYGFIQSNPADIVPRAPVQAYRGATALAPTDVIKALAKIDVGTLQGKRDYAILALALVTGKRLSEVANLKVADIESSGDGMRVRWRRTKGGKEAASKLPRPVGKAVMEWIEAANEAGLALESLWVALSHNGYNGEPLGIKGLQLVCMRHVGTTRFHVLRHTFAHAMEEAGAKVSDIQALLGHTSLQTTGIYLAALHSDENEHAEELAAMFGMRVEDI